MVVDITRPLNRGPRIQIHHALLCPSDIYRVLPIKSRVDGMPSISFSSSGQLSPHSAPYFNFEFLLRKVDDPEPTDHALFRLYSIFGPSFSGSKKALLGNTIFKENCSIKE